MARPVPVLVVLLVLLPMVLALQAALTTADVVVATTSTDDATVWERRPDRNFGDDPRLQVSGRPQQAILLRFVVEGVDGQEVSRATLVLHPDADSPDAGTIRRADLDVAWDEDTVTWGSAPAAVGPALAEVGRVQAGQPREVDLTGVVTGDGVHEFRLDTTSKQGGVFASREAGPATVPLLVLETGVVDPEPTDSPSPSEDPSEPGGRGGPTASSCLEKRRTLVSLSTSEIRNADDGDLRLRLFGLRDDTTVDLRDVVIRANQDANATDYQPRPVVIGDQTDSVGLCVLAPFIQGTQSRDLDWEHLKHDPGAGDHPALRIGGSDWSIADGVRVDNLMNAFRPVGHGLIIRNGYANDIRDDCIANDDLVWVRVEDTLLDGCYTAISARPDRDSALNDGPRVDTTIELADVLIRLTPMPGGHNDPPSHNTFGHIWKWSDVTGDALITDSIIMVDELEDSSPSALDWPGNVSGRNVTIVWGGKGPYPGEVPKNGVDVVTDVHVWEDAREEWLARHGCTNVEDCDMDRLVAPTRG